MKEVVSGGIAALGAGVLAGMATYGGVGALATASTGTAIATLSGAAATNATLAWLAGGSLSAGGFGMAVGARILGGIVAAPVLAVGSMILASKAEAAKHDAYANRDIARVAVEEMERATELTHAIQRRFDEVGGVLKNLNRLFKPRLQSLANLVQVETDYRRFSDAAKKGLHITVSLAETLKRIIESPIIDQNGGLTYASEDAIESGKDTLKLLE